MGVPEQEEGFFLAENWTKGQKRQLLRKFTILQSIIAEQISFLYSK